MTRQRKANIRENDEALLQALRGRLCVFKEKDFVRLVNVSNVIVDSWGVRFTLRVVESPGAPGFATYDPVTTFKVSGAWQVLGVSETCICAAYASWLLVVRVDLVERVRSFAAQAQDGHQLRKRINELLKTA